MDELNFDSYENIVKGNFYADDFAYMGIEAPDANGNRITLFPEDFPQNNFFDRESETDTDTLDFF